MSCSFYLSCLTQKLMLVSRRKTRRSLDPFILLRMLAMNKSLFTSMHPCKWHIWDRPRFLELRLYPEDSGNSQTPLLFHDSTSQVLSSCFPVFSKAKILLRFRTSKYCFWACIYLIIAREMLKYVNQFLLTITNLLYPKLPITVIQYFINSKTCTLSYSLLGLLNRNNIIWMT